jgi:DNA-directed RNA polymerase subunit RPC12/RpoP
MSNYLTQYECQTCGHVVEFFTPDGESASVIKFDVCDKCGKRVLFSQRAMNIDIGVFVWPAAVMMVALVGYLAWKIL